MEARSDGLWGIEEVSRYLGIPQSSVYKMTAAGTVPHVKLGGLVRFRQADIDRWLDLLVVSPLPALDKTRRVALAGRRG
jgi:excisionase family DNA binding protein